MRKQYNIKWNESDGAELRRTVKNFNAKISRLQKKYNDDPKKLSALPEKVSVKQIKDLVATRQDLKRELNSLQRFFPKRLRGVCKYS